MQLFYVELLNSPFVLMYSTKSYFVCKTTSFYFNTAEKEAHKGLTAIQPRFLSPGKN